MFRASRILGRPSSLSTRKLCTTKPPDNNNKIETNVSKYEAYRQLDKLDFMTAAKILFSDPPKKKKFGIDFHLVQLFFACLPSLAVYLVAQYARHEMRKMDAELEERKKKEVEEIAKEMELKAKKEKEARSADIWEVKERLDKLEEVVREIVVEPKKQPGSNETKDQSTTEKQPTAPTEPSDTNRRLESNKSSEKDHQNKENSAEVTSAVRPTAISGVTQQDQRSKIQSGGTSKDEIG
ncbi:hypothetical protein K2173_019310 [Erythroxylum novogranatense]|uniref:Uncharacterized protein n=1 Tax=Erythroxylum novogranatense TaxID=1862640 RepID=A0AAV8ST76_9ROSI|nr:hypothetical protein K2173_019310 [Erythroxylum novogranatense]